MEILLIFLAFTMWWAYRADRDFAERYATPMDERED